MKEEAKIKKKDGGGKNRKKNERGGRMADD